MVPTVDTQLDYLHLCEASVLSVIPFAALKFKGITAGFKTCEQYLFWALKLVNST